MAKLTQEQFEFLQKFEDRLISAVTAKYAVNILTADLLKIKDIYESIIEKHYTFNKNCSACRLKLLQRVAPYYFEFKKEVENGKTSNLCEEPTTDGSHPQETRDNEGDKQRKNKKSNRGMVSEEVSKSVGEDNEVGSSGSVRSDSK